MKYASMQVVFISMLTSQRTNHLSVWTTHNIPNISHDLAIGLSEVHLAYGESGTFSLLCKNTELKTKARKLFNHQNGIITSPKFKELQINLIKIENTNEWPDEVSVTSRTLKQLQEYRTKRALNPTMATEFTNIDSDSTEIYKLDEQSDDTTEYMDTSTKNIDSDSRELYKLEEQFDDTIEYLDVSTKYIDSDSTELYELEEQIIDTIEYLDDINNATKIRTTYQE